MEGELWLVPKAAGPKEVFKEYYSRILPQFIQININKYCLKNIAKILCATIADKCRVTVLLLCVCVCGYDTL